MLGLSDKAAPKVKLSDSKLTESVTFGWLQSESPNELEPEYKNFH
jgi:hypothetical protein